MIKNNFFLKIFFSALFIFSLIKLYDNSINRDAWQYGEWLINYQHGFVRRGLFGEFIYLISKIFSNNIQISFFLVLSILCFFYYYLNYYLIKNVKFNFIFFLIIFSPLFYLFFVVISKVGIKKEILLYIFYLFYLIFLSSKYFTLSKNWLFIFCFPFLLFNHEAAFFYFPYLIFPILLVVEKKNFKYVAFQIISSLMISCVFMIFLYSYKGSPDHVVNICRSLVNYAPVKCDWWGPIFALSHDLFINIDGKKNLFFYLSVDFKTLIGFMFYIFYGFIPLFLFLKFVTINSKSIVLSSRLIFLIMFTAFVFSMPLFHIAEDWSRWFSIHFHMMAFLIFFLEKIKLLNFENNFQFNQIEVFFKKGNLKKFFIIFLFIYATFFHHHHFFFKDVKLEFTYFKIFKKINSNF